MAKTNKVYNQVIDEVGNKMQLVFSEKNSSDSIHLLQQLWRNKLVESGVIQSPSEKSTTTSEIVQPLVCDLNVPLKMPKPTPLETRSICFPAKEVNDKKLVPDMKCRRIPPFMRQSSSGPSRPWLLFKPVGVDHDTSLASKRTREDQECPIEQQAPMKDSIMPSKKRRGKHCLQGFSSDGQF